MFFIHFLEHVLTLHPSFFGSHVKEYLTQKLLDDVEGVCTGDYYIVCVMDMYDISEGKIIPGSGLAEYTIIYRAIVWKPFKGETVDAIVTSVKNQGIFAEVGPLTVFVSKHLIPPEIKWDPDATPPQYTDNADQVIEKGTNLRIKLIGLRNDVRNMFAIGSIREDYLGFVTLCQEFEVQFTDNTRNQNPVILFDYTVAWKHLSILWTCTNQHVYTS
ncbi:DNA-directed RNA polymerase II subunit RPB7 [Arthroderma uncinatum]|uniref:DNA-directed RNA polymerase II subunit RPB7 n=1 Tax=Arthroderma uncinatum TaxID=74035 RepID=UPI00144AB442|nr:DNA-directed RNA polymerase II subunit RPB7 [Arthroderma uncinatum]KAF3481984.1 DNA-directed RNA polymerase II subunit RPB7 [Arthroderma uncinatum]